jgi:hypothetical protein
VSRATVESAAKWFCTIIPVLAVIGAAAKTVGDGATFLWPGGVVILLATICVFQSWLLWGRSRRKGESPTIRRTRWEEPSPTSGGNLSSDSAHAREKREAAYAALLTTTEPYINAHRGVADFSVDPGVYLPDLEEAEDAVAAANQHFVAARQGVEQYGIQPVLDAALAVEDAVNRSEFDEASRIRRDRLVPAVRNDMGGPMCPM